MMALSTTMNRIRTGSKAFAFVDSHYKRYDRGDNQNDDHHIFELVQKAFEEASLGFGLQLIGSVLLQAPRGLIGTQALLRLNPQLLQYFFNSVAVRIKPSCPLFFSYSKRILHQRRKAGVHPSLLLGSKKCTPAFRRFYPASMFALSCIKPLIFWLPSSLVIVL